MRKLPTKNLHSRTDNYKDLLQGQGQGLTSLLTPTGGRKVAKKTRSSVFGVSSHS